MLGALWSMYGLLALGQTEVSPPAGVRVADERIVLRTVAGDLVLALYPDVAPRHVRQLLRLVQLGCYDSTHFRRVEPGFVLQLAEVYQRQKELTREQSAAIRPLPAEFSKILKHQRGTLSMAHRDNEPDSAETSFSILLDEHPHLDGKYTIFGHVEVGMRVVDHLVEVPLLPEADRQVKQPLVQLEVLKAEVFAEKQLREANLQAAHAVGIPSNTVAARYREQLKNLEARLEEAERQQATTVPLVVAGVGLVLLLALGSFFLSGRIPANWQQSLTLLIVLTASFLLLILLTPYGQRHQIVALGLFLGAVGLFKLLSRFESVR